MDLAHPIDGSDPPPDMRRTVLGLYAAAASMVRELHPEGHGCSGLRRLAASGRRRVAVDCCLGSCSVRGWWMASVPSHQRRGAKEGSAMAVKLVVQQRRKVHPRVRHTRWRRVSGRGGGAEKVGRCMASGGVVVAHPGTCGIDAMRCSR